MFRILSEAKNELKNFIGVLKEGKEIKITITIGISENKPENKKKRAEFLNRPIEELGLPIRAERILKRNGVHLVRDILKYTPQELLRLKNMGRKSANEIQKVLEEKGLSLSPSERKEVR